MKKTLLLPLFFLGFLSLEVSAQSISLQAYTGYQFFGSMYTRDGQLELQPSNVWGLGIDFGLNRSIGFNALYVYQNTDLHLKRSGSFYDEQLFEMDIHYIMVGSSYHHNNSSKVTPFGGVLFGLSIMEPKDRRRSTETFLAIGAQGGARLSLTNALGINIRAQLLAPLQGIGAGLWCGTGGCDVGLSSGSTIVQMNVMAGVDIKLN